MPFDPQSLVYQPTEAVWVILYRLPDTSFELEVTVEGTPEAPDVQALALVSEALSTPSKLVLDSRLPQRLFAPWGVVSGSPEDWSLTGVHGGYTRYDRTETFPILWWWFQHPDDTYGCYYAGYDKAVLNYWPLLLCRHQW